MTSIPTRLFWLIGGLWVVAASQWIAWRSTGNEIDYHSDAAPAIDALAHLRIGDFLSERPLMGPFSLIVRAPFAALADFTEYGGRFNLYWDDYRFGVFPCLIAGGLLGLAIAHVMERRGASLIARAAVVVLSIVNPVSLRAVQMGHPEEILGAAVLVGAALAAFRNRPVLASVLVACALLNKQWAFIGAPTVLLMLAVVAGRERTRRAAVVLAAVTAALLLPLLIVDAQSLWTLTRQMADLRGSPVWPASVWYAIAPPLSATEVATGFAPSLRHMPDWLGATARPLLVALGVLLPVLFRNRVREDVERGFALLALVMLIRCALDPANNGYYHVPFFVALLAADAMRGRFWATAVAVVVLQAPATLEFSATTLNTFYIAWALPFLAYLVGRAWGFDWTASVRSAARGSAWVRRRAAQRF